MIIVYILAAIGVLALGMLFYNWLVPDQSEIAPRCMSVDPPLDAEESARGRCRRTSTRRSPMATPSTCC